MQLVKADITKCNLEARCHHKTLNRRLDNNLLAPRVVAKRAVNDYKEPGDKDVDVKDGDDDVRIRSDADEFPFGAGSPSGAQYWHRYFEFIIRLRRHGTYQNADANSLHRTAAERFRSAGGHDSYGVAYEARRRASAVACGAYQNQSSRYMAQANRNHSKLRYTREPRHVQDIRTWNERTVHTSVAVFDVRAAIMSSSAINPKPRYQQFVCGACYEYGPSCQRCIDDSNRIFIERMTQWNADRSARKAASVFGLDEVDASLDIQVKRDREAKKSEVKVSMDTCAVL